VHRGYTKRWRKRWDKDYCKDHLLFTMMEYFIDHANYRHTEIFFPNVGAIPLKRGQHIFGTRKLAEKLGVDRQRIRTKLKILKKIEFLTLKPTHHYTIATILNYDIYQSDDVEANPPLTHAKPTPNPQLTTPKKDKKDKKVKYPAWLDMDLWKNFKEHRQKLRAPMTAEAERRNINKLEKLISSNGANQEFIIGQSIEKGWKGLFPVKEDIGTIEQDNFYKELS
jgi:hypothetical protein